jgi:hypothetical protein
MEIFIEQKLKVTEEHLLDANAGKQFVLSCRQCPIYTGVKKMNNH